MFTAKELDLLDRALTDREFKLRDWKKNDKVYQDDECQQELNRMIRDNEELQQKVRLLQMEVLAND